jgi:hypothetical protein
MYDTFVCYRPPQQVTFSSLLNGDYDAIEEQMLLELQSTFPKYLPNSFNPLCSSLWNIISIILYLSQSNWILIFIVELTLCAYIFYIVLQASFFLY